MTDKLEALYADFARHLHLGFPHMWFAGLVAGAGVALAAENYKAGGQWIFPAIMAVVMVALSIVTYFVAGRSIRKIYGSRRP